MLSHVRFEYRKFDNFERPYLVKRADSNQDLHSHFENKKLLKQCINLIKVGRYPKNKTQKEHLKSLLTEEEFKTLDKKDAYFNRHFKY